MTSHLTAFHHPRQVKELKKKLGITLKDTTGLLSEQQFAARIGCDRASEFRKRGLIKPIGWTIAHGLGAFCRPRQITELKRRLRKMS